MKIQINITKEVLKESMNCDDNSLMHTNCAIAVAARKLFGDTGYNGTHICLYDMRPTVYIPTSKETQSYIYEFDVSTPDERQNLPEFYFEIEVPEEVIELIGINEVHRVLSESKTLQLVS